MVATAGHSKEAVRQAWRGTPGHGHVSFLLTLPALIVIGLLFAFPLIRLLEERRQGARFPSYAKGLGTDELVVTVPLRTLEFPPMATLGYLTPGAPTAFLLATPTPM